MRGARTRGIAVASLLLGAVVFIVTDVDARGRGGGGRGGGGFSRSGPAAGGSFRGSRGSFGGRSSAARPSTRPAGGSFERPSTRPERPSTRPERPSTQPAERPGEGDRDDNREDRQDWRDDAREDRQDYRDAARYQRAEYAEDLYTYDEWAEDRWSWRVGAALSASTFRSLSCTPTTVVVGSTTYYQCGSSWYNRAYQGGQVTYIVVNPPPGS
jgi:hypothetical protein